MNKKVSKCAPARFSTLNRLVHLDVPRISTYVLENDAYIRQDSETSRYCFQKKEIVSVINLSEMWTTSSECAFDIPGRLR